MRSGLALKSTSRRMEASAPDAGPPWRVAAVPRAMLAARSCRRVGNWAVMIRDFKFLHHLDALTFEDDRPRWRAGGRAALGFDRERDVACLTDHPSELRLELDDLGRIQTYQPERDRRCLAARQHPKLPRRVGRHGRMLLEDLDPDMGLADHLLRRPRHHHRWARLLVGHDGNRGG